MTMTINSTLSRTAAATVLAVTILVGSVGAAGAVPRGDGPSEDRTNACLTAYHIMEWAKGKRQTAGDIYDRVADAAFAYIDQYCDGVDFPQPSLAPVPRRAKLTIRNGTAVLVETVQRGEPDGLVLNLEPPDRTIAP